MIATTTARARTAFGSVDRALVVVAAGTAVMLWASAFVGIRSAGRELSPGVLALGRLLVGSATLGAVMLVRRESLPRAAACSG